MNETIGKLLEKIELEEFPQPEYIRIKHPVIMCHGYGSVASILKPTPLQDACMLLRSHGIVAFAPNVVPYASIEDRAKDWTRHVRRIMETTKSDRVNIIAHSMGGLDLRFAVSRLGLDQAVASLTTIATPHRGSSLAELGLATPTSLRDMLSEVFNWLGTNLYPSMTSDVKAALEDLTRNHVVNTFNPAVPDMKGVEYFSWSAGVGKGTKESINSMLIPLNRYIFDKEGVNDGFVSSESAVWGNHLGQIGLSHTEQIHMNLTRAHKQRWHDFWINQARMLSLSGL
jgi:triacylglycerol lipase